MVAVGRAIAPIDRGLHYGYLGLSYFLQMLAKPATAFCALLDLWVIGDLPAMIQHQEKLKEPFSSRKLRRNRPMVLFTMRRLRLNSSESWFLKLDIISLGIIRFLFAKIL